jgi:hypothetical protein
MGGALLLMIGLTCVLLLEHKHPAGEKTASHALPRERERALQAVLVATVPFMLLTNTWVLPFQAALVCAWMAYRLITSQPLCCSAVLLGGLVPLLLAYPFLSEFGAKALETPIHLVEAGQHTPLSRWLLMLWPQLLLILAAASVARAQPVAWLLLGITALLLGLSELIFVDDPLGGKFNRFNTSLKWWSWLHVATLLGLGAVLLGAHERWIRWLTLTTLVLVASYSVEMAYYWHKADKPSFAKLHGHHWLTKDPVNAQILAYLQVVPKGVVLEGIYHDSYTPTSAMALFANKPSLTGWPAHEYQWRGSPPFIYQVGNEAKQFYQGTLSDSLQWLAKHHVAYIVWREVEQEKYPDAWRKIQQQITRDYFWLPFKQYGDVRLGIWQRKRGGQR